MPRHERRAEAGREHRLRLLAEPDLGAGDLRRIAGQEMIHRLLGAELGDRRHDAERVAGQHDDVLRVRRQPVRVGIRDEVERIAGPRVLGQARIVDIGHPGQRVEHDIFEHRAEAGDRRIDLRLGGRRQVDDLGVAAALEIEDAPAGSSRARRRRSACARRRPTRSSCRCRTGRKRSPQSPFGPTLAEQCIGSTSRAGSTKFR